MSNFADTHSLPVELLQILNDTAKNNGLPKLLSHILESIREIGTTLRSCGYSSSHVGTQNSFGDNQLEVDVKTDEAIFKHLRNSGLVHVASSEESPTEVDCNGTIIMIHTDTY